MLPTLSFNRQTCNHFLWMWIHMHIRIILEFFEKYKCPGDWVFFLSFFFLLLSSLFYFFYFIFRAPVSFSFCFPISPSLFFFFIVVIVWIFSLFKKFYLFFNWRIIPSQNFVVFCQTSLTSFQLSGLFQGSLFKQIPGWPCFLCGDRKELSEQLSQAEAWKITRNWPS